MYDKATKRWETRRVESAVKKVLTDGLEGRGQVRLTGEAHGDVEVCQGVPGGTGVT